MLFIVLQLNSREFSWRNNGHGKFSPVLCKHSQVECTQGEQQVSCTNRMHVFSHTRAICTLYTTVLHTQKVITLRASEWQKKKHCAKINAYVYSEYGNEYGQFVQPHSKSHWFCRWHNMRTMADFPIQVLLNYPERCDSPTVYCFKCCILLNRRTGRLLFFLSS